MYSARIGKDVATTAAAAIKLTLIARIAVSLLLFLQRHDFL
jgi:hypothetical protein